MTEARQPAAAAIYAIVAVLAAAVAAPSLLGELVLDDSVAIVGSQCVTEPIGLGEIFSRNFWCQAPGAETIDAYRPWPVVAWRALWLVGGGEPWPFHALNLLLHVLCAVQIARLWIALAPEANRCGAAVAGALFAVLPIHIDAVASAVGAAELWALLGSLVAVRQLVLLARGGARWRIAVALGALALALFSKESAVVTAVLALILLAMTARKVGRNPAVAAATGVVAVAALYLLVRATAVGGLVASHVGETVNPLVDHGALARVPMAFDLLWRYLQLSIVGGPLSADYSAYAVPVETFTLRTMLGVAATAAVAVIAWRGRRRLDVLIPCLWFGGGFVLISNLLTPLPAIFAERLFYAPSAPLCLLAGVGFVALAARTAKLRRYLSVGIGVLVLLHGVLAGLHAHAWTTTERITTATVAATPGSARANFWRAHELARQGKMDQAELYARAALDILPEWGKARALLAAALDSQGNPKAALAEFTIAFEHAPKEPEVVDLFIQFMSKYGHDEPAMQIYERHRQINGGTAHPDVRPPRQ